ncbi:MAG: hypothetical protein K2Z81_21515 [Cyanobacteria bacterium]|nr:hypothetical protein [Cyanobacteriota bacterium]
MDHSDKVKEESAPIHLREQEPERELEAQDSAADQLAPVEAEQQRGDTPNKEELSAKTSPLVKRRKENNHLKLVKVLVLASIGILCFISFANFMFFQSAEQLARGWVLSPPVAELRNLTGYSEGFGNFGHGELRFVTTKPVKVKEQTMHRYTSKDQEFQSDFDYFMQKFPSDQAKIQPHINSVEIFAGEDHVMLLHDKITNQYLMWIIPD